MDRRNRENEKKKKRGRERRGEEVGILVCSCGGILRVTEKWLPGNPGRGNELSSGPEEPTAATLLCRHVRRSILRGDDHHRESHHHRSRLHAAVAPFVFVTGWLCC